MKNLWRPVALAALTALLMTNVASAQETVTVTEVTVDKFQVLHNPTLRVTGTITCDATGEVEGHIAMTLTQRDAFGIDNSDLLSFQCSTEPTRFNVGANNFRCEATEAKADCFQPGAAIVRMWLVGGAELVEQRVILRR